MKTIIKTSLKQINRLAKTISKQITGGEIFALVGPLGAGKTTFVQRLAQELKVKSKVTSPTFVLMQTYKGINPSKNTPLFIHHLDLYRLHSDTEVARSGLTEYWGEPNSITLIEWADKAQKLLPNKTIVIKFLPV